MRGWQAPQPFHGDVRPKVVFMYPGQGAQYFHMGAELFRSNSCFRESMQRCDSIAAPYLHRSMLQHLYGARNAKHDGFASLALSNACLVSIEYSMAHLLIDSGLRPDLHLGYSLGEFTASVIADVVSLEEAIWFVIEFAKVVAGVVPAGRMLAIFDSPLLMKRYPAAFEGCVLSGANFSRNFVVSGRQEEIERLRAFLQLRGVGCYLLPVDYGFHSHLVDPAQSGFMELSRQIRFGAPSQPIASAVAGIHATVDGEHLWNVIRRPVHFEGTVREVIWRGDFFFVDVGPSGSLAAYVKYILPPQSSSRYASAMNRFGRDTNSLRMLQTAVSDGGLALNVVRS